MAEASEVVYGDGTSGNRNYVRFYERVKRIEPDEEPGKPKGPPEFKTLEYIEIIAPGDKTLIVDREARDEHKREYPQEYAAFKAGKDQSAASGTPLGPVAVALNIPTERAEMYAYLKVRTVEQLAGIIDGNLPNFGPGALEDRRRAQNYLAMMRSQAPVAEMKAENEALKAQLAALAAKVEAMAAPQAAAVAANMEARMVEATKPRRGRPPGKARKLSAAESAVMKLAESGEGAGT